MAFADTQACTDYLTMEAAEQKEVKKEENQMSEGGQERE